MPSNEKAYVQWVNHHLRNTQEKQIQQLSDCDFPIMLALISTLNKKVNLYNLYQNGELNLNYSFDINFKQTKLNKRANSTQALLSDSFLNHQLKNNTCKHEKILENPDRHLLVSESSSKANDPADEVFANSEAKTEEQTLENLQISYTRYLINYVENTEKCVLSNEVDRKNLFSSKYSIQKFILSLAKFYKPKCVQYTNKNTNNNLNTMGNKPVKLDRNVCGTGKHKSHKNKKPIESNSLPVDNEVVSSMQNSASQPVFNSHELDTGSAVSNQTLNKKETTFSHQITSPAKGQTNKNIVHYNTSFGRSKTFINSNFVSSTSQGNSPTKSFGNSPQHHNSNKHTVNTYQKYYEHHHTASKNFTKSRPSKINQIIEKLNKSEHQNQNKFLTQANTTSPNNSNKTWEKEDENNATSVNTDMNRYGYKRTKTSHFLAKRNDSKISINSVGESESGDGNYWRRFHIFEINQDQENQTSGLCNLRSTSFPMDQILT